MEKRISYMQDNKIEKKEIKHVIYEFKCINESVNYVGMTARKLGKRIKEHCQENSPVGRHLLGCDGCKKENIYDRFEVIGRCQKFKDLRKLEAILIKEKNPSLNTQVTDSFNFVLKL